MIHVYVIRVYVIHVYVIHVCVTHVYLGRLRETAAPEMVFVRLGGPDLLRGSFAGSFAGVCVRDSRFYSVAAVQSVRFEARRSRKSAPGRLRGAIFPSLFDPRRKRGHAFFRICFGITF